MRNFLIAAMTAAALLGSPAYAGDDPAEPTEAALLFAGGFAPDQLSGMLSRIGARQPQMMAASQAGGQAVARIFDAEIDRAVAEHAEAWTRNMALAWDPLLNEDEMTSLTQAGAGSPHTEKYLGLRAQAGENMQALSQDLFRDILGQVIANTLEKVEAALQDEQDRD